MGSEFDWEDVTGYSKGERGKVEPRSWQVAVGQASLTVTQKVWDKEGTWYATYDGFFDEIPMKSLNVSDAKYQAVLEVERCLDVALNAVGKIIERNMQSNDG